MFQLTSFVFGIINLCIMRINTDYTMNIVQTILALGSSVITQLIRYIDQCCLIM
jgi:hypothetical protein